MTTLQDNIAAWEDQIDGLRLFDVGEWTVFHDRKFVGAFEDFHDAATFALSELPREANFLIRELYPRPAFVGGSSLGWIFE